MRSRPGLHSTWELLVWASGLVLVIVLVALAVEWISSSETRVTTYAVTGSPTGIVLHVHSGNVDVLAGANRAVEVRRTEHLSFGHKSRETRSVSGGTLSIDSACPTLIVGTCSADYRLTVPDNVPITVRTDGGAVHLAAFRGSARIQTDSGNVTVDAFCGFTLVVRTGSGNARTATACSPQHLTMQSNSGDVDASVPPGRYRLQATSDSGSETVSGISQSDTAPFGITATSKSGDVSVKGTP
jgi:Putative adhesin